jgi:hypothetical protein
MNSKPPSHSSQSSAPEQQGRDLTGNSSALPSATLQSPLLASQPAVQVGANLLTLERSCSFHTHTFCPRT